MLRVFIFFDLQLYVERKNPRAALEAFRRTLAACHAKDLRFVIKVNTSYRYPKQYQELLDQILPIKEKIILIDRTMTDAEVKALHLCCDAFVSLHRCAGFGFGLAEAMCFGKPTIATGYSGNMEFMTPTTAFLLDYQLILVPDGAYPQSAAQVWADPDVDQAAAAMIELAHDSDAGRVLGAVTCELISATGLSAFGAQHTWSMNHRAKRPQRLIGGKSVLQPGY